MAIAKVLEYGQITIPKPIRESLGLKKGDVVDVRLEEDCAEKIGNIRSLGETLTSDEQRPRTK